jgi:NADH-quinone oxidoreductase subunit N
MILSLIPEITILIGALFTLLFSLKQDQYLEYGALAILALALLFTYHQDTSQIGVWLIDRISMGGKYLSILLTALILAIIAPSIDRLKVSSGLVFTLLLLALLGVMVMVSASDYLLLFLGIELVAIPSYILCSITQYAKLADEAGLKYFIMGSISSIFYLYGVSLVYGGSGTLDLQAQVISNVVLYESGLAFILCAFFFKIGLFPFHYWVPDVYQASEMPLSLWIISVPKIGYLLALIRMISSSTMTMELVNLVGCASLLVGVLMACVQTDFRRMLGYASISQMGIVLILLSIFTELSLALAIAYLLVYLVTLNLVWYVMLNSVDHGQMLSLKDLSVLKHQPLQSGSMMVAMTSMAGIPLTVGFVAKVSAIFAVMAAGFYKTLAVIVLSLPIAVYYYLNVIKSIYFTHSKEAYRFNSAHYVSLAFAITLVLASLMMDGVTQFCANIVKGVL